MTDLVIFGVTLQQRDGVWDIAVSARRITGIARHTPSEASRQDGTGCLAFPGFVDAQIHLDKAQIPDRCDLARRFGADAVVHNDFDLGPTGGDLPALIAATHAFGLEGRVVSGHVTTLSAMAPDSVDATARALAKAGIAVVALPATDLFLLGRDSDHLVPHGNAPLARLAASGVRLTVAGVARRGSRSAGHRWGIWPPDALAVSPAGYWGKNVPERSNSTAYAAFAARRVQCQKIDKIAIYQKPQGRCACWPCCQ